VTQTALDFSRPLPPVIDQRVPVTERKRLSGMSLQILERLRHSSATNRDFAEMFPPGAAWRTRVSDVRRWLERQGETVKSETLRGGLCRYWIEVSK
jgi:hypothetical protein